MNELELFLNQIKSKPATIEFQQVIDNINKFYEYTATEFINGTEGDQVINHAGDNEGSCKIFFFAQLNHLDESQTLNCFGSYYRDDVLKHPENTDHANIRTFMRYGWKNINFESIALKKRKG